MPPSEIVSSAVNQTNRPSVLPRSKEQRRAIGAVQRAEYVGFPPASPKKSQILSSQNHIARRQLLGKCTCGKQCIFFIHRQRQDVNFCLDIEGFGRFQQ